jgi:hypothetical protein
MASPEEVAAAAARRKWARMAELHPNWGQIGRPWAIAYGYADETGEIPPPYCGGPPEGWRPRPGSKYTVARFDGREVVIYHLEMPVVTEE